MLYEEIKKANIQSMKDKDATARSFYSVLLNKIKVREIDKRASGQELEEAEELARQEALANEEEAAAKKQKKVRKSKKAKEEVVEEAEEEFNLNIEPLFSDEPENN